MNFIFMTVLHGLKINSRLNKGIRLHTGTRITNNLEPISRLLDSMLFKSSLGFHSINEFKDAAYLYKVGEISKEEVEQKGNMITFHLLRESQQFVNNLWEIKDCGIYVRDGFLALYEKDIDEGWTYKASLSAIFTDSSGSKCKSEFSREEVDLAVSKFTAFNFEEIEEETFGGKYVKADHLFKNEEYNRMHRATYFTLVARSNSTLPMKLVSYCTALECLFTTGKTEVNHRIAERVAIMLGGSRDEKKNLFNLIKKAYDHRSSIIHGSYIKGNEKNLIDISNSLDKILRKLLIDNHEVFLKKDDEIDKYFLDLLFK